MITRVPTRPPPRTNCAFCRVSLTAANDSKEHIVPNAIGGRRTVAQFLCKSCNETCGSTWDKALADQFAALCTLLNIKRGRGHVRATRVQNLIGEVFKLHADGRVTPSDPVVTQDPAGNEISIQVQARSPGEFREILRGLAKKYPQIDVEKAIAEATLTREYKSEPWHIPLNLGGLDAGRSAVKSLVAMAAVSGIEIDDLEHAHEFLLLDGGPCFGYCNDVDVVVNRPDETFFHCVGLSTDPITKQVLGYVEYFGFHRIVACLSSSYEGQPLTTCYAVDPVRGAELDLEIELAFSPEEIQAIYEYQRLDRGILRDSVGRLLAHWSKKDSEAELERAFDDALRYARKECGLRESESISEEQIGILARLVGDRLRATLEHLVVGRRFTPEQMKRILQTIREEEADGS